jgi:hypothetical protein
MAKAIGPTFSFELEKAGLLDVPFSWGTDGSFNFAPSVTQSQKNQINAVYAAHKPDISNLLGYSDTQRKLMFEGGITVNGIATDVAPDAISLLHQNLTFGQANPSATFSVVAPDFSVHVYTAGEIATLYEVCQAYVKTCYDMQGSIAAQINTLTITTEAQIDNLYATIPKTYTT